MQIGKELARGIAEPLDNPVPPSPESVPPAPDAVGAHPRRRLPDPQGRMTPQEAVKEVGAAQP